MLRRKMQIDKLENLSYKCLNETQSKHELTLMITQASLTTPNKTLPLRFSTVQTGVRFMFLITFYYYYLFLLCIIFCLLVLSFPIVL